MPPDQDIHLILDNYSTHKSAAVQRWLKPKKRRRFHFHFTPTSSSWLKGALFTVQEALPLIPDGGSVILNASIVSIKALPAMSVYSATKAAIRSFARSWILGSKRQAHLRQCAEPWLDLYARCRGARPDRRTEAGTLRSTHGDGSDGTYGITGEDRKSRGLSRVRRRQLRRRHRVRRRWRGSASVNLLRLSNR